jgi:hypothetical protein
MAPKNAPRNWNDVQTAIATAAIVTTLGMWNLFAAPSPKRSPAANPAAAPTEEEATVNIAPTPKPQVKIYFTPQAPGRSMVSQTGQTFQPHVQTVDNGGGGGGQNQNNNSGGGGTVTTTKTS